MDRRTFIGVSASVALAGCSATGSIRSNDEREKPLQAKVDLHTHLYDVGGQEMADRYAELGFDALVGTDHYYAFDVDGDVESEAVGDYSDLEFPGPILDGVELSEGHHVNVIKSENEMIKQINHPMVHDDTAEDINELADRIGADLVEVTFLGEELSEYPTVAEAVEELDPMPTITSDAHSIEAVGRGHVVVEVEELTGDAIIRGLRRGNYSLGGATW